MRYPVLFAAVMAAMPIAAVCLWVWQIARDVVRVAVGGRRGS